MNKKIFSSMLCAIVVCVSLFTFAGCSGKNYTYSEFQQAYADYINSNKITTTSTEAIFDANGYVSVQYSNEKLRTAIAGTTLEDKRLMFTRLSSDASSDQALFEPALKASMLYMHKYIDTDLNKNVPTDRVNKLYSELGTLTEKTNTFKHNLLKFNVRDADFDKTSTIDQSFLKHLFDSYYDLIIASCALSLDFIDVANEYIWTPLPNSSTGRLGVGVIDRYYLAELTSCVDVYARFSLVSYYKQAYILEGAEYYTNKNPSGNVNSMLALYEAEKTALLAFENKYNDGAMSSLEKKVVEAYNNSIAYDELYKSAYTVASDSLSKVANMTDDPDEDFDPNSKAQAHKSIIKAFLGNEYSNKVNQNKAILDNVASLA